MRLNISIVRLNVGFVFALLFSGLFAISYGEAQTNTLPVNTNNFVTLAEGEVPWLERYYYYTAWPNTKDLPALKEVPNVQYNFEQLITEVLREGVLKEGWQKNVIRIKNWVPKQVNSHNPDAYVYRQMFDQGTLHICDSRPNLMIAYKSTIDVNFLEQPREALIKALSQLLKIDDFSRISLQPGTSLTPTYLAHVGSPRRSASDQFPEGSPEIPYSTYAMLAVVAKDTVFFDFQKSSVPGCVLDVRYPLFQDIDSNPTMTQKVLAKLENYKEARPEDIPDLIGLLKILPDEPTPKQLQTDPYRYRPILSTKLEILRKIKASITSINSEKNGVGLIQLALTAEKYFQRKDENPAKGAIRNMKLEAVDALRRIQTDEAALLNLKMIHEEKDPQKQDGLAQYLDDYPLFEQMAIKFGEQAEAAGIKITEVDLFKALYAEYRHSIPKTFATEADGYEQRISLQESTLQASGDNNLQKRKLWIAVGIATVLCLGALSGFAIRKKRR